MGLYVSTTGTDVEITELGIILPHPIVDYALSDQFYPEDLRDTNTLTNAIRAGVLIWKKTASGNVEPPLDYDPDIVDIDNENTGDGKYNDRIVTFKDLQQESDREKQGIVAGFSFSGTPKVYDVVFTNPYTNTNYVILIDAEVARSWIFENKTTSGFRINANANKTFTENVNWNTRYI